jgi:hypothetical protein
VAAPVSPLLGQAGGMLLAFVANLAIRAASAYASQRADKLFATSVAKGQQDPRHE